MLLLLVVSLLLGAVMVLCVRRNRESMLLAAMCLALTVYFSGLLLFIAKKGGYSQEIMQFLFLSEDIRHWAQYCYITLGQLGYLIAVGRCLFPWFLLEMAGQYSMLKPLRHNAWMMRLVVVPPMVSLVLYVPKVYGFLIDLAPWVQGFLLRGVYGWILCYVALALVLLGYECMHIKAPIFRRQLGQLFVCLAALSVLYLLYCGQDPGQVYRFYSYDYAWLKGVGYLLFSPTLAGFVVLVVVNVICGFFGLWSLLRYTHDRFADSWDNVVLKRSFDTARTGVSVFVHSMKNQLLSNRVLFKRIMAELQKDSPDLEQLRRYSHSLSEINEQMISRSEELYRTVKTRSVHLAPLTLARLTESALERFYQKYPEGKVKVQVDGKLLILADENYLSEALYNLLINAWEASQSVESQVPVELFSHQTRLYTALEVRDRGAGIPASMRKAIFTPFYSSKNSSSNWGMGLYYVRNIVKSHLGSLRVESRQEGGAAFFMLLPRYGQGRDERKGNEGK